MRSIHGVRYEAVSLAERNGVRSGERFPFGTFADLQDLAGGEVVAVVGVSSGGGYAEMLLDAFGGEVNGGPKGGVDMEAFRRFATILVPMVSRLAEAAGSNGDRAAFDLAEKLVALGTAGVPMIDAMERAVGTSSRTAEELTRWALGRDLEGAVYLEGLIASIDHEKFAAELVRRGLATPGLRHGVYVPLGGEDGEVDD